MPSRRHSQLPVSLFVFLGILLLISGCATKRPTLREQVKSFQPFSRRIYVLDFDNNGHLTNPQEVARAIEEINESLKPGAPGQPVKKIAIVSYGWMHSRDEGLSYYYQLAKNFCQDVGIEKNHDFGDWAVFFISWNSSYGAVVTSLQDTLPAPKLAEVVAKPSEDAGFLFTYWSKSRLAGEIGYNELRKSFEILIDEAYEKPPHQMPDNLPDLYLVGHSFGARLLTPLAKRELGSVPLKHPFKYQKQIKGGVFFQPALTCLDLPSEYEVNYPILVTQSRYDYGNSFLYPTANLIFNSYTFTASTANVFGSEKDNGTAVEALSLPFSIAWTAVAFPPNYLWTQAYQLSHRRLRYIPDTLAHVPVVNIPVYACDKAMHHGKPEWGTTNLGLFDYGVIYESAARVSGVMLGSWSPASVIQESQLSQNLVGRTGAVYVDCSDTISKSWTGASLKNPWWCLSLGDVDPVGSHMNFEDALYLVGTALHLPSCGTPEPTKGAIARQ